MKVTQEPHIALRPVPVVLVSCGHGKQANIISIAWVGVVCSNPPQVAIAVRPERHSHGLIRETGEFVLNIPSEAQVADVEYCGTVSGREVNKFAARGLTPVPGSAVQTPLIAECPVNIECAVRHTLRLGAHEMFIGEILAVHADESVLDANEEIDFTKAAPFCFNLGDYWSLKEKVGSYGYTKK